MEKTKLHSVVLEAKKEIQLTPAEKVFSFLSEFNFYTPGKDVSKGVTRFITVIANRHEVGERLIQGEHPTVESFVDTLVEAGYAKDGEIDKAKWSSEAENLLFEALSDFQELSPKEKKEFNEYLVRTGKHLMV
jgi:uncharacterized protein YwgA